MNVLKDNYSESAVNRGIVVIIDIIFLGILWLLCCLPVVTIGPASCAFYHAMVKCVRHGRAHVGASFFKALKDNFKTSFIIWLIFLLLIGLWFADMYAMNLLDPEGTKLMSGISAYLIIPVLIPLPWVFAYISRFENSTWDTLKFSVFLSIKNLARTVMLLLLAAAFIILGWIFPALIPLLPGFCCLLMSFQIEPVFKNITKELESDSNEDKWYNE